MNLPQHKKVIYGEASEDKFYCEECDGDITIKWNLTQHKKVIHVKNVIVTSPSNEI